MPRADRCKRKKEEELKKAASKVKKITTLFTLQKNTSNCNEETATEKSTQAAGTDQHEFQGKDSRNIGASKESPSVFEIQATGYRDCNEDLNRESLLEPDKEDFDNVSRTSNITPFKFSEPLPIEANIVTVEACSSNARVYNEESADFPISFHSEVTAAEDTIQEGSSLSFCTAPCCLNDAPFIPTEDDLKKTSQKQTTSSRNDVKIRKCTLSVFTKFPWASYCLTKGTIACFYCRKASNMGLLTFSYHKMEKAFCDGDFCNWKKCLEKLHKHGCSHCHSESVEKVESLKNPQLNVGALLDQEYKLDQEMHRAMLLRQLSSLQYLTRQGLAIRGDHEIGSNLIQLLKTRSEDVPNLKKWIENSQYTSPVIVNELIEMMGNDVLRSILGGVRRNSGLFGLIADESRDISNKEQLTCILRWVSVPELITHEDFVGLYHVKETDAETITDCLKDILLRCNLLLDDCRWQAYDGAATMSGHLSGVAARIKAENPAAHRIHCANHRLDLALKGCAKESEIVSETLTFVQDLAVFIRNSPKRMAVYEDIAKDVNSDGSVESLHLLCPTRWTVRTKSVSAILNNYSAIHATLLSIANDSSIREVSDKANGMAGKMEKFKTYLGQRFSLNLFSVCEQLAKTLQTKGITAQTAMVGVTALKGNLQQQREDFSLFYQQTVAKATEYDFVEEPKLPRRRQVPRRLQHGEAPQHQHESTEAFYRASYYEAIDACIAELNRRFDEVSYAPLQNLEDVFLNAANGQPFQFSKQVCETYSKQVDFEEAGGHSLSSSHPSYDSIALE